MFCKQTEIVQGKGGPTQLLIVDELTGCYNRQYALMMLQMEIKKAKRYNVPLSCVMVDIDGLKIISDMFGNGFGDFVLQKSAGILKDNVREFDLVCRFGADEFLVILPHTTREGATILCRRLIGDFSTLTFKKGKKAAKLDISLGVASVLDEGMGGFIRAADEALHNAITRNRRAGRNEAGKDADNALTARELAAVERYQARLQETVSDIKDSYVLSLEELVNEVDARRGFAPNHAKTVSLRAAKLAIKMGLPHRLVRAIRNAALLQDIGKIGIPEEILSKKGPFSSEEYTIMKRHPLISWELLSEFKLLDEELPIVLSHHERYDGSGYPERLTGERIPLGARIIGVADSFDAMTSARTYRKALSLDGALEEILRNKGRQFDPAVAAAFMDVAKEEALFHRNH